MYPFLVFFLLLFHLLLLQITYSSLSSPLDAVSLSKNFSHAFLELEQAATTLEEEQGDSVR